MISSRSRRLHASNSARTTCSGFTLDSPRSVRDRVGSPLIGYAFEVVCAAACPLNSGSDERVAHGLTDENLSGLGESRDTRSNVHGKTGKVVALLFDLPQVQAAAHLEVEGRRLRPDRPRDFDRDRRTRDNREEVVAAGVDLPRVVTIEDGAHVAAELRQQVAPGVVA